MTNSLFDRDLLAHTISLMDRVQRASPTDGLRVAAYVRCYLRELAGRGALDADDGAAYEAVLRQWHEEYGLPWLADAEAALRLLLR